MRKDFALNRENKEDHTIRRKPPVVPGIDPAPVVDGTTGGGERAAALREYYGGKQFEFGWASLCKMSVPDGLEGKTVLDIGCRRGRGVYKLSERVGATGRAIGVDWGRTFVEEAAEWSAHAASKSGLSVNNMAFALAFPEDLAAAGIEDGSVDVVWVNSVVNLFCDQEAGLREMARVLRSGGLLVCETVTADVPRDPRVVEGAKAIGNSVQAAPLREDFLAMLAEAGFEVVETFESHAVAVDEGFKPDYKVETVASDEACTFTAEVVHAVKR